MKRWILIFIVVISGTVSYSWFERHRNIEDLRITISANPYCSSAAYTCLRKALRYILTTTQDVHRIYYNLQSIMPHINDIGLRWMSAYHLHINIHVQRPCIYVTHEARSYVITCNGACVPARYIPLHLQNELPQILWNSNHRICAYAQQILQLYHNIPRTWWDIYHAIWNTATDVQLRSQRQQQAHIRTTSHRTISPVTQKQIQQIQTTYQNERQQPWIDIRFPRYAVVYQSIRGR